MGDNVAALAAARGRSCVEIEQWWGDLLLEHRLLGDDPRGGAPTDRMTIGDAIELRWQFLGVDMGRAPAWLRIGLAPLAFVTGWVAFERARSATFLVPEPAAPGDEGDWELIRKTERGACVCVPPGWHVDGAPPPEGEILVELGATAPERETVLERGPFRIVVRTTRSDPRATARVGDALDPAPVATFAFAAAVLLGVWGAVRVSEPSLLRGDAPPEEVVNLSLVRTIESFSRVRGDAPDPLADRPGNEGEKARKSPIQHAPSPARRIATQRARWSDRNAADRRVAEAAGVLGASEVLDALASTALSPGLEAAAGALAAYGGPVLGGDGLGGRGNGIGCDGTDCGGQAEGLGGFGFRGSGRGATPGGGGFGAKSEGHLRTVGGDPIVIGALDRSLIDEVIKRNTNAIRYCYQRELPKDPTLGGKIAIKFTIAKDGTVSQASVKSSTMGNASVESCLVGRFMRMQFPSPKGGGIVIVSYPFLFSPG